MPFISLKQTQWTIFFIVLVETVIGREHLRKVKKSCSINFFFWGITLRLICYQQWHTNAYEDSGSNCNLGMDVYEETD